MRRRRGTVDSRQAARKVDVARAMLDYMAGLNLHAPAELRDRIKSADATELRRIAVNYDPHPAARIALRNLDEAAGRPVAL